MLGDNIKTLRKRKGYSQEEFASINEQLVIKNRRARRIWMIIGGILAVGLVTIFVAYNAFKINMQANNVGYTAYLHGTVTEVRNTYILVVPFEDSDGSNSSDLFSIPISEISDGLSDEDNIAVGDIVTICYNGEIEETYPASLAVIYGLSEIEHVKE